MSREHDILLSLAVSLDIAKTLKDNGATELELRRVLTEAAGHFEGPEPEPPPRPAKCSDEAFVINVDGASRGNPGLAGAGVVIKQGGRLVEGIAQYLGRVTNNVAEYKALIIGLTAARKLGAEKVEVRADSELMVRQMNGQYKVKNPKLIPLYEEAKALSRGFKSFSIRHVPREQNAEADVMANRAIDEFKNGD